MPDDPPSPGTPADGNSAGSQSEGSTVEKDKKDVTGESAGNSSKSRLSGPAIGAIGAVLAAVLAAVTAGIFTLLSKSPTTSSSSPPASSSTSSSLPVSSSPSTPSCSGLAADVTVPSSVGSETTMTFHFNCPPDAGHQYMYVVETKNIGANKHSNYYQKDFNSPTQAGATITYNLPLENDTIGEENCIYVISPTFAQRQALLTSLTPQNYTLNLPGNIDQVSPSACETKTHS